jgi:hypothetical protein
VNGQLVQDITTKDIDVSADAIHWFHFGGAACRHDLPVYKSPQ